MGSNKMSVIDILGFKKIMSIFIFIILILPHKSRSEPLKEFIKACTYGVLSGTLVGAASLAFTKKPGDNLKNIARGASLGLYAGIALGAYVVYFVPSQSTIPIPEEENPGSSGDESSEEDARYDLKQPFFTIIPVLSKNGLSGFTAQWAIMRF